MSSRAERRRRARNEAWREDAYYRKTGRFRLVQVDDDVLVDQLDPRERVKWVVSDIPYNVTTDIEGEWEDITVLAGSIGDDAPVDWPTNFAPSGEQEDQR